MTLIVTILILLAFVVFGFVSGQVIESVALSVFGISKATLDWLARLALVGLFGYWLGENNATKSEHIKCQKRVSAIIEQNDQLVERLRNQIADLKAKTRG